MYAIRSYYDMVNEIIEENINELDVKISTEKAVENFNKAVGKGILKVMNKIGISTLVITSYSIHYTKLYDLLTIQQYALKKIQELEKEEVKDEEQIKIFEKIVTRSLFGNINASRNSA